MSFGALLTVLDKAIVVGGRVYRAARKFSRKRTEREQLEETARWDVACMPTLSGRCAVCDRPLKQPLGMCPGPPAAQAARRKL
jgi:hypothetical protein